MVSLPTAPGSHGPNTTEIEGDVLEKCTWCHGTGLDHMKVKNICSDCGGTGWYGGQFYLHNQFIRPELRSRVDELASAQGNSKLSLTEQIAQHLDRWMTIYSDERHLDFWGNLRSERDQQLDDMYKGYAEP